MRSYLRKVTSESVSRLVGTIAFMLAVCIIVSAPNLCFAQDDRETTWQPLEKILDAIGVRAGMRIGEAGAGRGFFTFPLARRVGPEGLVYANDISSSSLDVIRERAGKEGVGNIKIVIGAVEDPLFPEKNLDMIVMVYVLHDLERPVPFLKSVSSYLRPGGSLVVIERNNTPETPNSHFLTKPRLLRTVSEAGYAVTRTETFLPKDTIYICTRPQS